MIFYTNFLQSLFHNKIYSFRKKIWYNKDTFWGETMKKKELLVPAGNMECLRQAVFNGCDAVYLACKNFGARKFATNFTEEEILEAIRFCHLYGVRIYVTMNTLIKNEEVPDFLKQAEFLHRNGVDALIVQDFGMICLLREMFPNLEIHASTQANISSKEVCKLYYNIGVKRVVFARELTLEEIDSIDVPVEKEVFIHGALCVSYSGCCLMSSMLGGRSGNRGECAGVCRMPFSLWKGKEKVEDEKYLLSMKELNTTHRIKDLLESSIDSFKVEGRMKSPLYVGFITNFYRRLLDGEEVSLKEEEKKLKTIFHREFTEGHLFHEKESNIINRKSPNHIGLEIGRVVEITKNRVKIKLFPDCVLHQQDAIRFSASQEGFIVNYLYDQKDNLIASAENICFVDKKGNIEVGEQVLKTQDFLLEKEYLNKQAKRIPITYHVTAHLGAPLVIEIQDERHIVKEESNIVEEAKSIPVTKEDINRQLSKLGETPFRCEECTIEMDNNTFIPLKLLNEIRRNLVEKLITLRCQSNIQIVKNKVSFLKEESQQEHNKISCFVSTEEQLQVCLKRKNIRIYTENEILYEKYKNQGDIYYKIPRNQFSSLSKEKNLISDYREYTKGEYIGDYSMNIMNIYTAYYLKKIGFSSMCLSVELKEEEMLTFLEEYKEKFGDFPLEVLVYGRVENMIIKGNILNLKSEEFYQLIDHQKRSFPVFYDGRLTHILNWERKNLLSFKYQGKCNIRLDFYEESKEEVENELKSIEKK